MVKGRENSDIVLIIPPPKKTICVKIDQDLLDFVDRVVRELGYETRSDFFREAIIYYAQIVEKVNKKNNYTLND